MIEIYDFDPQLTTRDIIREMHRKYRWGGYNVEWGKRDGGGSNHRDKRLIWPIPTPHFSPNEFRLKWVDDTHALGIFASNRQGTVCLLCGSVEEW